MSGVSSNPFRSAIRNNVAALAFPTLAAALASPLAVAGGQFSIQDYAVGNNSGPLFFEWVAAGTGVADGGAFIDHSAKPLQAKQNFPAVVSVRSFGVVPGVDSTTAWQAIASRGGEFIAPAGEYIIDSVSLTKSITVHCAEGVTFKRKDGADGSSESYWNAGAAMFEVDVEGLTVQFLRGFTYDGNSENQTATEPSGWFLKAYPPAIVTGNPTVVRIERGEFKNGTSGYVLLRGDDVQKRYETYVYLNDCTFSDTIYGTGKNDPATPTALGYSPTYVLVLDYVRLNTNNFRAVWNKATGTGQYAACALNGTFFGVDYAQSGESHIHMHGTTYIRGLGRSAKAYNNDTDFVSNNGIGAIDMYGNAHTLFVTDLVADDCENVALRAKASLKNYTVLSATLTNCWRGLQVGPSSTGEPETVVYVGKVTCEGGTIPQLEFVGNTAVAVLRSVNIESADLTGVKTNPEALANQGVVRIRNADKVTMGPLLVTNAPERGIEIIDCVRVALRAPFVDTTVDEGLFIQGGDVVKMADFDIRNTGGAGVSLAANPKKIIIRDGNTENTAGYGVFCNTTTSKVNVDSVTVDNVSGVSRGFYIAGGDATFSNNESLNLATPLLDAGAYRLVERDNNWNP